MLEKCTDSYCLCLFQMRRKLWSSWMYKDENGKQVFSESDAAPLWHFNTPGMVALRKLMPVILYKFITRAVQNFFIWPRGEVYLCTFMSSVGSLRSNSPREIWVSPEAEEQRKKIKVCKREDCLITCLVRRSLAEKFKVFRSLFGNT